MNHYNNNICAFSKYNCKCYKPNQLLVNDDKNLSFNAFFFIFFNRFLHLLQQQESSCMNFLTFHNAANSHPCSVLDRKSTRLNSSHVAISYAVFCLKKKKITRP